MPNENLYDILARRFPESDALAFDQPATADAPAFRMTYAELVGLTNQYANALRNLGVQPGDRVSIQVEKSIANVALFLAVLKIGAIGNPLNTAYTLAEMAYFMSDAEPSLVVVPPDKHEPIRQMAGEYGVKAVETLDSAGQGSLADKADVEPTEAGTEPRSADDTACIIYTSGTTGQPKGAMITHGNVSTNIHALWEVWHFQPGDVLLHILPIYHVHGLFVAMGTALYNGSPMIWLPKPDFDQIIAALPRATVMMGVPTHYTRLLERPELNRELTAHMRLFTAGSAPLLAATHEAFEARTGHKILERYGMTEAGMICSNPYDGERIPGTVGYPLPGVSVRVTDKDGHVLPAGEIGMVEVKGPNIFKGYWRRPQKTAEEFRADGFFITGDQGVLSEDGRLSIVGREKDMIISGGLNIYPKEVERELDGLEGIGESAVIGVPHPDFGEGVVAVATRGEGTPPSEADIIGTLAARLAKFKVPKRVIFVDVLPRNAMGKVQKNELRDQYAELFSGE
ncbi:malonate--CoA ligase [Dichotomicrobium thermohalophilum]|uniref:Malonyl-CoA/methylmalonyl-CoA synthetase n=1 Tax=Dichotomicrobium thermohalophilum TaxID=933063 RepID=A0A397PDL1_9HYPH|nr:malonyl-CoA synthase [Dichotomicrobium thermohalophilum]RIA47590.1 malonyl-CoA/methylmalonyl-CoA synthetase [Dichotomicrobium thermohalophilum]